MLSYDVLYDEQVNNKPCFERNVSINRLSCRDRNDLSPTMKSSQTLLSVQNIIVSNQLNFEANSSSDETKIPISKKARRKNTGEDIVQRVIK